MAENFRFRKHTTIGAEDAEEDTEFLAECFVDTGDLEVLCDCKKPQRIVLGRTGTGKTALILRLIEEKKAILIKPEALSFNYLSNSTVLQFFSNAGVKLDLFFRLLWRHVFTVELLKKRYNIRNEQTKRSFLEQIRNLLTRDKKKEKAIDYLLRWGNEFWQDTEYRIKEITSKVETNLKENLGAKLKVLDISAKAAQNLSEEERTEVVSRGQEVINSIQVKELSDILEFLNDDIFNDDKQTFFLAIDRLDENWIDDSFRYSLIRSLIETLRDFRKVRNVKIAVALRKDLLERVFRYTRDAGFQEEKYRDLYLTLTWTSSNLKSLLDKRVNFLIRQSYTKQLVSSKELLPKKIGRMTPVDYILERTLRRPREIIEFFNACIAQSHDKPTISAEALRKAEGEYSKDRLRSLSDEWQADYPLLIRSTHFLRKKPSTFKICDLDRSEVEEFCLDFTIENPNAQCPLAYEAKKVAEGITSYKEFLFFMFHILYRTGVVGIKLHTFEGTQWVYDGPGTIAAKTLNEEARVSIHPMFWRVLGVKG